MKTRSIFFSLLLAASTFALLSNCSGKKEEAHSHDAHEGHGKESAPAADEAAEAAGAPQFTVDQAFKQQLTGVFTAYVSLKEAFVSSDPSKVKAEAASTQQALAKADMKLLTGAAHNDWMNYLGGLETSLKEIQATSDIEAQRTAFSTLSDHLYKSIKAYGLGGATAYYEFCPMAFNDQGGYWLSDDTTIRNPYFGDKMLTCGSVKEKLQ
jgi:Cu(I)/Ag(I) efflux system membrane fusion protein